ncbi:MAG: multifunctional CCA addition/repair protein [Gammaproteobacteria bacterium]
MQIYLVGGAVRDKLLGLPVRERDWVVVGATPEELMQQHFQPIGKDFPVFLHPQTKEEYALARTERKTGRGYTQFQFYSTPEVTLEEDLKRRDLTINAMAMTEEGQLIDPYHGFKDLQDKILRHVSDAFIEDPVRILRVARLYTRFSSLGFKIAPETMKLMRTMVTNGEVNHLVAERVWQELQRAIQEPEPQQFFICLRECGALAVLFPELDRLYGVPSPPKWHPEIDTGVHTMMVLKQASLLSSDPVTRFAALLHDLGKGITPMELWPRHKGHEEKSVPLVNDLCKRVKAGKDYRELAVLVARFHGIVHRAAELRPATVLRVIERADAIRRPLRFLQFLLACEADAKGRPGHEAEPYPQKDLFLKAFDAVKSVSVKALVEAGLSKEVLVREIRRERIKAIVRVL